jgi:hypothetical protein
MLYGDLNSFYRWNDEWLNMHRGAGYYSY